MSTSQNHNPATTSRKLQTNPMPVDSHSVTKRLQSELMTLMMSSTPGISAFPESDSNLFHWLGTIIGPDGTHYAGLKFKLKIDFVCCQSWSNSMLNLTQTASQLPVLGANNRLYIADVASE